MKNLKKLLLASIIMTSLTACNGDGDDDENSYVRVYHASPDAPKVDVWLDGQKALEAVDYQQSSGKIMIPSGTHTVQIEAILANGETVTVLAETDLNLLPDTEYNIVATGKAELLGSGDALAFGPVIVAREALIPIGARVQAIHSAPDAPTVDIFITAPGADLSQAMPFADDISYKASSEALEVAAGDYQIRITDANDSSVVYFDSGAVNVPAGSDWVALATNNTAGGNAPVSLVVDTATNSIVLNDIDTGSDIRVVHAISDAPAVDVLVNGNEPAVNSALDMISFKEFTEYLTVPAGDYSFSVNVDGSGVNVAALSLSPTLTNAMSYTAIAIGNLADGEDNDELFVVVDDKRRIATTAKLRVIHASTLAKNVDIYVSSDATPSDDDIILQNVAYKGDSTLLEIMPGDRYVMVTPTGDRNTIAIGPAELPFEANSITTLVAIDDPMSGTAVSVISLDD